MFVIRTVWYILAEIYDVLLSPQIEVLMMLLFAKRKSAEICKTVNRTIIYWGECVRGLKECPFFIGLCHTQTFLFITQKKTNTNIKIFRSTVQNLS